ncbi:Mitochondrial distribution and morphology protein 12, partial [Coemansia sp. IMI 209127]
MFGSRQTEPPVGGSDAGNGGPDISNQPHRPPTPRNRLLKSLYARAINARLSEQQQQQQQQQPAAAARTQYSTTGSYARGRSASNASSVRSGASSTRESLLARSTRTTHTMFGNLRRVNPRATVELARPAPEVEFSRVADSIYPVLDPYASPANSASLLSLRASQNPSSSELSVSPPALSMPSSRAASALGVNNRGGSSLGVSTADLVNGAVSGASALLSPSSAYGSVYVQPFSHFDDERDVPFRANAVEIADQDDKNECAFLPGACAITGIAAYDTAGANAVCGSTNDYIRSQTVLSHSLGKLQPVTSFSSVKPSAGSDRDGDRMQPRVAVPSLIYKELTAISEFNQQAQGRVQDIDVGEMMGQFPVHHIQRIIRQLLDEIEVAETRGWDDVVFRLVANAITRVRPNVLGGDRMDLRNYVRIKRIPGAAPANSQYISGLVFTKNLAHKRMPRYIDSPRIMLLTLPLEYSDSAQSPASRYVSFDGELRMQQGFTEKLVQRIASAAPDLVFTEKLAPRHVLEGLMRNNIAVAHGIKRSVIRAIARCTGAEVVTSMSKFSDYPRIGSCRSLIVQTYEDPSIPEFRKSFIFLDGCNQELGGTIVLRGESFSKLGEIKQVVDLVVCLAYSMLLEAALLVNEYVLAVPGKYGLTWSDRASSMTDAVVGTPKPENESLALEALNEYNIVLSSSPCVRIPPPQVLVAMRQNELAIRSITERFNKLSTVRKESPMPSDVIGGGGTGGNMGVSFLVSRQQGAASANRMRQQYESEIALHESLIREGRQFLKANPYAVSLWDYQGLVIAYMLTCRKHDYMMCVGPEYHLILYYDFNTDVTLGQYLEMCFDLSKNCPTNNRRCTHPLYEHRHSYIHNKGKLDVTVDEFPCPVVRLSEVMLMWGECNKCGKHTPVTTLSDESWRYSFGKYLETTFYNDALRPRACICPHDAHQHYVRCFSLRNMVTRFTYSSFPIWSVSTPTTPLYFNVEVSIRLKDKEASELRERLDSYYQSLMSRLEAFPLDLVYEDKIEDCRYSLSMLSARAATEQVYVQQTLEQTLRNTHPADTLVIVVVYEALQTKVVEWNLRFSELVQSFIQLDATSNNRTGSKKAATFGGGDTGASTEPTGLTRASTASGISTGKKYEIDSLEVIDELHSAAHHPQSIMVGGGGGGDLSSRLEMPRLGASPTEEKLELLSQSSSSENLASSRNDSSTSINGKWSSDQSIFMSRSLRPRLHRRLSMETMKKERERQERLQEKMRRSTDALDVRGSKYLRQLQKANMAVAAQAQGQLRDRPLGQGSDSLQGMQIEQPERSLRHVASGIPTGRYSTTRLIGGIATNVDDVVRIPQQPVFPELRGRQGKPKTRFSTVFGNKGVRPLLDILGSNTFDSGLGKGGGGLTGNSQFRDNVLATPSRIPGIRTYPQQPPQNQQNQPQRQRKESDASSRPLSSFGRPPSAHQSNIPRPPNIRSRATSPTEHETNNRPASANAVDADKPSTGGGEDASVKASSNVFLRLAKRLNSAKGQSNNPAVLGTVPRRMNLLLPAAAQYVSQTPSRRTTVSQVHARTPPQPKQQQQKQGVVSTDGTSYRRTPPRRHSYQLPPNSKIPPGYAEDTWQDSEQANDYEQEEEHFISSKPSSGAISGVSRYDTGEYGEQDRWQPHSVLRHRSATVSQVQPRPVPGRTAATAINSRQDERTPPQQSSWRMPVSSNRPHGGSAAELPGVQSNEHNAPAPEQKASMASRASGLIPNITRRLGLGFGFRSNQQQRSSSGNHSSAQTSDGDTSSVSDVQRKQQRVPSAGDSENKRTRGPIPPQLVMDHGAEQQPTSRSLSKKRSGKLNRRRSLDRRGGHGPSGNLLDAGMSSESFSISIDSNSESDGDNSNPARRSFSREILGTSSAIYARSNRNSFGRDSIDDTFPLSGSLGGQADLITSSPMRTLQRPNILNDNVASSATDSEDGGRGGMRRILESSSQRAPPRLHRDSSTEDDDLDNHEPNLHLDQSDASSDDETESIGNGQDASSAVTYLQSVGALGNAISVPQDSEPSPSHELSVTSVSTAAAGAGMLSEKMSLVESTGLDVGLSEVSNAGDSSAAGNAVPQENLNTLWRAISNLLMISGSSQLFQIGLDLVYPLDPTEHVVAGSPVIVRETEPSSIIAFTLMANEYRAKIHDIFEEARNEPDNSRDNDNGDNSGYNRNTSAAGSDAETRAKSPANEFDRPAQKNVEETVIERVILRSAHHHLPFQFVAGQTKFVCRMYYAPQFEALRRCYGCEDSYIESLSRCIPYDAKGGKSGSTFMYTRDERFIIKQVSKPESEAFLKFAPSYFDYMYWTYRTGMRTMLAKIFGFCRVTYRSAATGKAVKMNVIIMENLFYERKCNRIFDLKGSERNRMVEETGSSDAVFQDENLLRYIRGNPICVSQQTKSYLHDAIWNDTLFLSMMNVMDYSLLVGFDEEKKELVVGIVDFIRTFTRDKKLESWVKEARILGGGGKDPTI